MACSRFFLVTIAMMAMVHFVRSDAGDASTDSGKMDLPAAAHGFEQWIGVVDKALSFQGQDKTKALQSFIQSVLSHFNKQSKVLSDLQNGDLTSLFTALVTPKTNIQAPVFFSSSNNALQSSMSGVTFSLSGVSYTPCALSVGPVGASLGAVGIDIAPQGINISPTGVQVQPQGANISPALIVIAPFDTTVAGQGLNIAPALIAISPVRTVVNPVGPLSIMDSLVSDQLPHLP